jgi:hypothetical protein
MTAQSQVPAGDWWKWVLGIGVGAVAFYGAATVLVESQKPDPWAKGSGPTPKRRTDFEGVELYVLEGDKESGEWDVMITEYLEVDGEDMSVGSVRHVVTYESKHDAIEGARELAKGARASRKYKLVRVVATAAEHREAEKRRRRAT